MILGCNPKTKNSEGKTARLLAKDAGFKDAAKECLRAEKGATSSVAPKNTELWALRLHDFTCARAEQLREVLAKFDEDGNGRVRAEDLRDGLLSMAAPLPDEDNMRHVVRMHETDGTIDYQEFLSGKKYINKQYSISGYEKKGKKEKKGGGSGGKNKKKSVQIVICTQTEAGSGVEGVISSHFLQMHVHTTDVTRFDNDKRPSHLLEDDSLWYLGSESRPLVHASHAALHADLQTLKEAIDDSAFNLNQCDKYFKTPLMYACMKGDLTMIKYLIENGYVEVYFS